MEIVCFAVILTHADFFVYLIFQEAMDFLSTASFHTLISVLLPQTVSAQPYRSLFTCIQIRHLFFDLDLGFCIFVVQNEAILGIVFLSYSQFAGFRDLPVLLCMDLSHPVSPGILLLFPLRMLRRSNIRFLLRKYS